ncbi:MAG: alpha-glucosidase/alpha-galactosidase [Planctomycetota bacterium]
MAKITFMGAGSTVFAKNILGDVMLTTSLHDAHIALYDIDGERLHDSKAMLDNLNVNINQGRATITAHLGVEQRKEALRGAGYVVNAIQVGGYDPCTITDFEVPKKYGLRQTIADTLGIGGIFRSLRTIPVMLDFARDMHAVCPDAWMLNYTNPMAMITAGVIRGGGINCVGLCHSVQGCAAGLLAKLGLRDGVEDLRWRIAGINHQAWLLELRDGERDLYPVVQQRAAEELDRILAQGGKAVADAAKARAGETDAMAYEVADPEAKLAHDLVRLEIMRRFGHYVTESSEHFSEYCPWFIKRSAPELIDRYNIPLDEYPYRCVKQIESWAKQREELVGDAQLSHEKGHEFGSYIIDAMETDTAFRVHGNVMNTGLITNLPRKACVEVACLVDQNGVQPTVVGDLPEQLAAMNRTNINPQILTVEAALSRKREYIYQAAMLDPHTAAELTIDQIRALCDELIDAHGDYLPSYT